MRSIARWLWALPMILLLALAGCGGGGGGDETDVPTISSQPVSVTVNAGSSATFQVAATGSGTLSYQWQRNGTPIPGATSAQYATGATVAGDDGAQFVVVVSNASGSVTSSAAVLTVVSPTQAQISGEVLAVDGTPLQGATVTVGDVSATTQAGGRYSLLAGLSSRAVVHFSAAGYASTLKVAALGAQGASVSAQLSPVGVAQSVTVATGGTVSVAGSTAQVVLPANALVREGGGTTASAVTVSLTPIDPSQDVNRMPGDYTTLSGSSAVPIESFGAIEVSIADNTGARYNLASGSTATIRIPLATRTATGAVPASIPLFYMNEATGRWVQEGTATLRGTAPNQYYEGTVTHFSTWNADQVMQTVYVNGCVRDANNQPVSGAYVASDGISYSGSANTLSTADGSFRLPVKTNAQTAITGLFNSRLTNTISVTSLTTDLTVTECLVLSQTTSSLNIRLTWGQLPYDVDSHLYLPDGEHVYFGNNGSLLSPTFAALDVDDTSGYGPEVITVTRLMVGTYRYFLYNYSGSFTPGMTASPVRVELNLEGTQRAFLPGTGEGTSNYVWHAFDLVVAADCSVSVVTVNSWSLSGPTPPTVSTPVYCSAP